MVLTPSNMLPLGTQAPAFELLNPSDGKTYSLTSLQGQCATVIMFICNHCPYVVQIKPGLIQIAHDYQNKGVKFIGINANDSANYPDDAPELMPQESYPFPYLFDATQAVAKTYDAACTPDCYVFDSSMALAYRGQFDDARPGNDLPVTGQSLREAIDDLLAGKTPSAIQKPSIGCSIKWRQSD